MYNMYIHIGNSKVMMFVNISPANYNVGETLCSLNFATRCRNVELGQAKKQIGGAEKVVRHITCIDHTGVMFSNNLIYLVMFSTRLYRSLPSYHSPKIQDMDKFVSLESPNP